MRVRPIMLLLVAALAACSGPVVSPDAGDAGSGSDTGAATFPPADYTLSSGVHVAVDALGAVTLDDRRAPLGGLAAAAPVVREFALELDPLVGGFVARRRQPTTTNDLRFAGSFMEGDSVVLRYTNAAGVTARIELAPDRAGVTRARTIVDGLAPLAAGRSRSIAVPLACSEASSFLGFGAQYDALDHRGEAFDLFVREQGIGRTGGGAVSGDAHTTYFPMPWFVDRRGFGVLARTEHRVLVDLCRSRPDVAWMEVERDGPAELAFYAGPTLRDVLGRLREETGRPARPPAWAFEKPWIGVQGGRDAVLAEVAALDAAGVPFGAIWSQDWSGRMQFSPGAFGVDWRWVPDETLYPDLASLTAMLRARDVRFLAYANPFVVMGSVHDAPMRAQGLLARDAQGAPIVASVINREASFPDLGKPETGTYIRGQFAQMTGTLGIRGWMCDFGEWLPVDAVTTGASSGIAAHQTYPTAWQSLTRTALQTAYPDGDWVMFTRSGWTGTAGATQLVWIGDQETNFSATDGLPTVVPALISLGLSGLPYVTHDIGGFSGTDARSKEVFLRWTELGAFTPVMRTHEGLRRTVNWDWNSDDETKAHFARFARIHGLLAPDFDRLADEAESTGVPMLRALALVFPDDPGSARVSDEMLVGDSLLIAPVVTEGATTRAVYLPPGAWFHVWSGTSYTGGQTVTVDAPIGAPPVFARGVDRMDLRAVR